MMTLTYPTYRLRVAGIACQGIYETEGEAVKAARRNAKMLTRPVLVECSYGDHLAWWPLRIEGKAE